ncbi:uncharacterized protein CXorf38 homolog isoform X2 [Rhineura floridana]|uniref:uncharacterized protein CXorf38 homolog isoform X2 n=1 Tax=Rhineura floridana TaxID=261503 RepID=UPI002AC7F899|nr:uncharacterized protein CXorf38 homolog isoform X2 [Rhineura floridana]
MALAELASRLNCAEYKNWVKAGHSLLLLRGALQRFAGEQIQDFHRQLLARLSPPGSRCNGRCTPRGKQFQPVCSLCKEWKKEILNHHTHRNGEVNWGNCRPWLWPSNSWELAKAYMPRGKADICGPDKCDASALLNLFTFCDHFSNIDQKKVREVIKCHNELMHSSDMKVSSSWLKVFGNHVQNLLTEFQHVPEAQMASTRIEKDLNRIQNVRDFLNGSHDLQRRLQTEMQNLKDLEQKMYAKNNYVKETQEVNYEQEKDGPSEKMKHMI